MEYLVTMTTHVPDGTSDAAVEDIRGREAAHTRELVTEGHLRRLWRPPLQPGEWWTLGLFEAADRAEFSNQCSSRCLSGCGVPMRSLPFRPIRTTRAWSAAERGIVARACRGQ